MNESNFQEYCEASQTIHVILMYFNIIGIHTKIKAIQRAIYQHQFKRYCILCQLKYFRNVISGRMWSHGFGTLLRTGKIQIETKLIYENRTNETKSNSCQTRTISLGNY